MAKKKKTTAPASEPPIEAAMEELQVIVESLESGQEPLDDALKKYERGVQLLRACHEQLESAAQRIEIVTGIDRSGNMETSPFDATATGSNPAKSIANDVAAEAENGVDPASLF